VGAVFYCMHALTNGIWHIQVREKICQNSSRAMFVTFTVSVPYTALNLKETKGGVFIYYVYLKACRHGSHSFICKYTLPAFPS